MPISSSTVFQKESIATGRCGTGFFAPTFNPRFRDFPDGIVRNETGLAVLMPGSQVIENLNICSPENFTRVCTAILSRND
jgi:hypothetical protein